MAGGALRFTTQPVLRACWEHCCLLLALPEDTVIFQGSGSMNKGVSSRLRALKSVSMD